MYIPSLVVWRKRKIPCAKLTRSLNYGQTTKLFLCLSFFRHLLMKVSKILSLNILWPFSGLPTKQNPLHNGFIRQILVCPNSRSRPTSTLDLVCIFYGIQSKVVKTLRDVFMELSSICLSSHTRSQTIDGQQSYLFHVNILLLENNI